MQASRPDGSDRCEGRLARLADTMFVHKKKVIAGWVAVFALVLVFGTALEGSYTADYNTPGSESKAASQILEENFDGRSGESVDVVWRSSDGATSPAVAGEVDQLLKKVGAVPGILPGTTTADAEVSDDGQTAIARLPLNRSSGEVPEASGAKIGELVADANEDGLEVAVNGAVEELDTQESSKLEMVGLVVAAMVLLFMFGAVVAAGVPLVLAFFGVGIAFILGGVLAAIIDTPDWASDVSIMIGLGVGIDYALLILTRYRTAVQEGRSRREANVVAMTTAGHSVLVAGGTVVIALMGLFLMRLPYLYGVALSTSLTVLVVMAVTTTLLPAIVGLLGRRIDSLKIPGLGRLPEDPDNTAFARWARRIDRRPYVAVAPSLVVLAVLASPLTGMRFGFPDAGNNPKEATTRQAYDMIAEGFGEGANASLLAVASTPTVGDRDELDSIRTQIAEDPDVVDVAPAQYNESRDTAVVAITPSDGPSSPATKSLVERLRSDVLADSGIDVKIGGDTATTVDQADVTQSRLPLFIGAVVLLSILLLWRAFRAPIIALKAGVLTILSILAAYGVVAYVAEGGWAGRLIGIDSDLPVPPFIPVMMFAVTFGLAMDYEVFLVSRMKEERDRLGDAREGAIIGLARTSRVITAAALIMVSVFGEFALSTDLVLKLVGVGLASAILIDAILIRMVLLPAVMSLLGERAWWRPGGKPRTTARAPVGTVAE
ncbi:MAG: MMPL family transporter [Solirubrobacterales bacterium]